MQVVDLFREGKIDHYEHDVYVLFEGNDLGREFLKNKLAEIAMSEPLKGNAISVMHVDGRRSEWREIKHIINRINFMMEIGE